MKFPRRIGSTAIATILCSLMLGACRKGDAPDTAENLPAATLASELMSNNLGSLPGAVYRSQAKSPIHWQPWTRESMKYAMDANRLVFAVVAMPQQPGFQNVLASMSDDPALVSTINDNYVPILIDGDAAREIGLLTADLCAEIKRSLQLPLFMWLTPEGNPIAWIPAPEAGNSQVTELFNQSHSMVSRMWRDDSEYVRKNSGLDNRNRRLRIGERKNTKVMSQQPAEDVLLGLRQLVSFYDPYSRSFDEAGGLFPTGAIDLLATAAVHPGLPEETRARCLKTTSELLVDLLPSAMFDPLEGGIFSSRRGNSWSLPAFNRDCASQAKAAVALINAYRATGNKQALVKALDAISYAEKSYTTSEGLFSVGMSQETDPAQWLWSVEDIEKELSPEDAAWWIKATGMKGLGNLPSEVDPRRDYFRSNSLGISQSLEEIAAGIPEPVETFAPRYEMVRKTLLKARNTRLGPSTHDDCSHAGATFRMVSAYVAAFAVTGDEEFRKKAVSLLNKARTSFSEGPKLRLFSKPAPNSVGEGRAFLYGLALQAAIDVSVITSDEKWLDWSENLATTAAELFTGGEYLKECPDDAKIIELPITDLTMLFDDSTAGLISYAECRLAERERPLVASFSKLATPLPTYSQNRPILHTDLLQATIARAYKITLLIGPDLPVDMKLTVERLPPRMIQRRAAKSGDDVPAGSIKIIYASGEPRIVSTSEALTEALLPSSL